MAMAMPENPDVKETTTLTTFCAGISILRAKNRAKHLVANVWFIRSFNISNDECASVMHLNLTKPTQQS